MSSNKLYRELTDMFGGLEKSIQDTTLFSQNILEGDCYLRWEEHVGVLVYGEIVSRLAETTIFYVKSYSVIAPAGREERVHASQIHSKLNIEQFAFMKRCGWPPSISKARLMIDALKRMN